MAKVKNKCYRAVHMPEEMEKELIQVAKEMGPVSVAVVMRIALKDFLDKRREEKRKNNV